MDALAYRPADAARQLGISRSYLYELIADEQIEVIRLGKAVLVPRDSLQRLIDSRRANVAAR